MKKNILKNPLLQKLINGNKFYFKGNLTHSYRFISSVSSSGIGYIIIDDGILKNCLYARVRSISKNNNIIFYRSIFEKTLSCRFNIESFIFK